MNIFRVIGISNTKKVEPADVTIGEEQQNVFNLLETTTDHCFITGKAGTGKSLLLQYFKSNTTKKIVVVAPTGVAAINIGGQTIHSLFGIPPAFIPLNSLNLYPRVRTLLRHVDAVMIDEISMVRADLMDAIDHLLRLAKGTEIPFGGVQIIMFGDLYQLPPVVSDGELHKYFADNFDGYFFFNAKVWQNTPLKIIELSHVFRQKDAHFIALLDAIRRGTVDTTVLNTLNQRANIVAPDTGTITLTTTNKSANMINESKLDKLPGKEYSYLAEITGDLERTAYPTEELLRIKPGAQVMMLKNDRGRRWVNGTLGIIHSLSDNEVKVTIDGITYSVPKETWKKIKYQYNQSAKTIEEEVVSTFTQYPLRLAWAITIHKSQGQTFQQVVIDMGDGAFAHGQTYVALSRCTTLEGIYLTRELYRDDIIIEAPVVNFMEKVRIR